MYCTRDNVYVTINTKMVPNTQANFKQMYRNGCYASILSRKSMLFGILEGQSLISLHNEF